MTYITKIIETLGGWKKAWSLVKPSTSTTVMAIVLFVLVIFFPEHQWQSQEDKDEASHPLFNQTQQVEEETKTTSAPQETTTTQVEDDTNNEETDDTSVQNTSPASEAENDDSYNDQGSNESYAPQPSQQESAYNTPDGTQGVDDTTDGYGGYNNRQDAPSQDQEPAPEEDAGVQNYNGEGMSNQQ